MNDRTLVEDFFAAYDAAKIQKRTEDIASFMDFPLEVIAAKGRKRRYDSHAQMIARGEEFKRVYQAAGICEVARQISVVYPAENREILVHTHEVAKNSLGQPIANWRTSYILRKGPDLSLKISRVDAQEQVKAMEELGYSIQSSEPLSLS